MIIKEKGENRDFAVIIRVRTMMIKNENNMSIKMKKCASLKI